MEQKTYTQAGYDALKSELADINEKIEENKRFCTFVSDEGGYLSSHR